MENINGKNVGGRPSIIDESNRELAYRLIQQVIEGKRKPSSARSILKLSPASYYRLRKEFEESGRMSKETIDYQKLDDSLRNFDKECFDVEGITFSDWLKTKRKVWKPTLDYAEKVWSEIWGRPNLFVIKDRNNNTTGKLIAQFLNNETVKKHSRRYKELIKPLFIFLHREDICKRDLSVSAQRDPREIRVVPEMCFTEFPTKILTAIEYFKERYGEMGELEIKFKIISKCRTGKKDEHRGLFGIRLKEKNSSFLIMQDVDNFSMNLFEKDRITWEITWIPLSVRKELFDIYTKAEAGSYLFENDKKKITYWSECCVRAGLPRLSYHDLRKVGITWLYVLGIPLEIGCDLNVGWKDLNTAKTNYLQFRRAITKDLRKAYSDNIPAWFKEGLDQYN